MPPTFSFSIMDISAQISVDGGSQRTTRSSTRLATSSRTLRSNQLPQLPSSNARRDRLFGSKNSFSSDSSVESEANFEDPIPPRNDSSRPPSNILLNNPAEEAEVGTISAETIDSCCMIVAIPNPPCIPKNPPSKPDENKFPCSKLPACLNAKSHSKCKEAFLILSKRASYAADQALAQSNLAHEFHSMSIAYTKESQTFMKKQNVSLTSKTKEAVTLRLQNAELRVKHGHSEKIVKELKASKSTKKGSLETEIEELKKELTEKKKAREMEVRKEDKRYNDLQKAVENKDTKIDKLEKKIELLEVSVESKKQNILEEIAKKKALTEEMAKLKETHREALSASKKASSEEIRKLKETHREAISGKKRKELSKEEEIELQREKMNLRLEEKFCGQEIIQASKKKAIETKNQSKTNRTFQATAMNPIIRAMYGDSGGPDGHALSVGGGPNPISGNSGFPDGRSFLSVMQGIHGTSTRDDGQRGTQYQYPQYSIPPEYGARAHEQHYDRRQDYQRDDRRNYSRDYNTDRGHGYARDNWDGRRGYDSRNDRRDESRGRRDDYHARR